MKLFILILFPCIALASGPNTKKLVDMAVERAPILQATYQIEVSRNEVKQAKTLGNPILTIQAGSLHAGNQKGPITDFTLNQPFPWPGKRQARIKNSEYTLKLSELDLEEAKVVISHRVFLLCAEITALEELEKHRIERKHRFSLIHKYLATRPIASPRLLVERDLIEAQIKIMERGMLELSLRKSAALSELEILTGSKNTQVQFALDKVMPPLSLDQFEKEIDNSLRFKKLEVQKKVSENQIETARLEARPDILLGVNYREERVEPINHFYHAQVSISLPIIDHGQHSVETARANLRKTEAQREVEIVSMKTEMYQAHSALLAAYKSSQLFPIEKLKKVEKNFGRAESAFRKGQIDAMLFLQSDTQIHEIIDQMYLSRLNYYSELSKLKMLIGKGPEF